MRWRGWLWAAAIVVAVWLLFTFGAGMIAALSLHPWMSRLPLDLVRSDGAIEAPAGDCRVLDLQFATGSVRVEPGRDDRGLVVVRASIAASRQAAHDRLVPRFDLSEEGVLRVVTGSPGVSLGILRASYEVSAPPGMELRVRTSNGSVAVSGWEGPVTVATSNGNLDLELGGSPRVDAATSNGNIDAGLGRLLTGEHRLTTSNGSIRVRLDPGSSLALDARTSNGKISLAMPGWMVDELETSRAVRARLGEGEASLTLRTSNGSITVEPPD